MKFADESVWPLKAFLTLAPDATRALLDVNSNDPVQSARGMDVYLKFVVDGIAMVVGNFAAEPVLTFALVTVGGAEAVPIGALVAVSIAVADLAGGAYDMVPKTLRELGKLGTELDEAGAVLAEIFGAFSHVAERIGLALNMSIEEFFGDQTQILNLIGPSRVAAANRRYANRPAEVLTQRSGDDWREVCIDGFCTRTYKKKPPSIDPWWYGGGPGGGGGGGGGSGGPEPPPPPPELLAGVTVNPDPHSSGVGSDETGNAALKSRPNTTSSGRVGKWEINPASH